MHYIKHSHNSYSSFMRQATFNIPILQIRMVRFRVYKTLDWAHTFCEWERQDLNTGLFDTRLDAHNCTIFISHLSNSYYIE